MVRTAIAVACFFVGCGGAASTDLFSGGASSGGASSGGASSGETPPVPTPPPPTCTPTTWYRDRDGDGVGGTETKMECDAPNDEWVATGGDCDDDNEEAFPGQSQRFTSPYQSPSGRASFDYDCDGTEEQGAPVRTRGGPCTFAAGGCTGSGYISLSPRPPGAGLDPLCGAVKKRTCTLQGNSCVTAEEPAEPTPCH